MSIDRWTAGAPFGALRARASKIYDVAMRLVFLLLGIGSAMALIVGYVAWRDRRQRGSFVDPTISRDALIEADRQAVQGRLAAEYLPVTDFVRPHRPSPHDL